MLDIDVDICLQKGTWRVMLSEGPVTEYKLIKLGLQFGFDIL